MQKQLSTEDLLMREAEEFRQAMPGSPGEEYLLDRGFPKEAIQKYRLGYAKETYLGAYAGDAIAIPYYRYSPVGGLRCVSIRYRKLDGKPKYVQPPGTKLGIYNAPILLADNPIIGLTEGELDCITANIAGLPSVGLPGANSYKDYYRYIFEGFRAIILFADGDQAGESMANNLAEELPNLHVKYMDPGKDLSDILKEEGIDSIKELVNNARDSLL